MCTIVLTLYGEIRSSNHSISIELKIMKDGMIESVCIISIINILYNINKNKCWNTVYLCNNLLLGKKCNTSIAWSYQWRGIL